MENQTQTLHPSHLFLDRSMALIGGSVTEGIAGIAGAVLAILGLVNIYPYILLFFSTIAVGIALFSDGIGIGVRFSRLLAETEQGDTFHRVELGSGMSVETLGGATGIVLGILALIGITPQVLIGIAAIVFGAATFLSSRIKFRLNTFAISRVYKDSSSLGIAREIADMAAGTQLLVGLGVVILGILSLIGYFPLVLTLAAMLTLGIVDFLAGQALSVRFSEPSNK